MRSAHVRAPTGPDDAALAADFYDRHGWYVTPVVLPTGLVDDAHQAIKEDERDRAVPRRLISYFERGPGARGVRANEYIVQQSTAVAALALSPVIGEIAAALARTDGIRLFNSSVVAKRPAVTERFTRVGWHCDRAYWPTCSSNRMLTAWIPLQDTTLEAGTLVVLDGSHRWTSTDAVERIRAGRSFFCKDHEALQREVEDASVLYRPVALELKRGQVSFHHCLTFHSSGLNTTDAPRLALAVHLQDRENTYQLAVDGLGEQLRYIHDDIVRRAPNGSPDYADPEICPMIWKAGDPGGGPPRSGW